MIEDATVVSSFFACFICIFLAYFVFLIIYFFIKVIS